MSLKKSEGNMYPWVTHSHAHLGGECPHKCVYCYVDNPRFGRPEKYTGDIRLIEKEFKTNYGKNKTIFIENCNDMFAKEVPTEFINKIIRHCLEWPNNIYVFQTKNPARYNDFLSIIPENSMLGTTIETNRDIPDVGKAPSPKERMEAMTGLDSKYIRFVTIEPILDFDVDILAKWVLDINPKFLNIGADSKDHNLAEPTIEKILELVEKIRVGGIEVREKHNMQRLRDKA